MTNFLHRLLNSLAWDTEATTRARAMAELISPHHRVSTRFDHVPGTDGEFTTCWLEDPAQVRYVALMRRGSNQVALLLACETRLLLELLTADPEPAPET